MKLFMFSLILFAASYVTPGANFASPSKPQEKPPRFQAQEKNTDPFARDNSLKRGRNPAGVNYTIRLKDNRTQFRQGEIIRLELIFSSSVAKTFILDNANYDHSGRLDMDSFVLDHREGTADPLSDYFNSGVFGFVGGGMRGNPELTEKPPAVAALRAASTKDDSLFWLNELYGQRAGDLMSRLERVAPQSARLAQAKGLSAEYDEDYAKAEEFYREALRRSPETAGLHFCLGHVLRLQGKDEEAAAELERDVQNHLALFERALIHVKGGEFRAAIPLLEQAVRLSPPFSDAKTELAKCYLQTDQAVKAVPLLESVISRRQDHPTAHFLLSRAYRALHQPAFAQRELEVHRKLIQTK